MIPNSGPLKPEKSPYERKFRKDNLNSIFKKNSMTNISNSILTFLKLYKKHLRTEILSEIEDIPFEERHPEFSEILQEIQKEGFNINYENGGETEILKAIVSFLTLSNQVAQPFIYTGTEDIPFEERHTEFKKIMKDEFLDNIAKSKKEEIRLNKKDILAEKKDIIPKKKNQKKFISPEEFVNETAPKPWVNAKLHNSLSIWLEELANKHGIIFDFVVGIMHDFDSKKIVLNVDGNKYNLTESLKKWGQGIKECWEDDNWYEIKRIDYIEWFEQECEEEMKTKDAIVYEALNNNSTPHFREFMWLAYKTCDKFIIFREKYEKKYRIFLKIGEILSLVEI